MKTTTDFTIGGYPTGNMPYRMWLIGQIANGLTATPDNRTYNIERDGDDVFAWRERNRRSDAQYCIAFADAIIAELDKANAD